MSARTYQPEHISQYLISQHLLLSNLCEDQEFRNSLNSPSLTCALYLSRACCTLHQKHERRSETVNLPLNRYLFKTKMNETELIKIVYQQLQMVLQYLQAYTGLYICLSSLSHCGPILA